MHFYPIVGLTYQCQNKYTQGASKFQTLANCHVLLDSAVRSIFKCQHSETWQMESYISDGNTALPLHQIHNLICWILWRQSGNVNFSVEFNPGRITSQVFGPQNNTLSQQQESLFLQSSKENKVSIAAFVRITHRQNPFLELFDSWILTINALLHRFC